MFCNCHARRLQPRFFSSFYRSAAHELRHFFESFFSFFKKVAQLMSNIEDQHHLKYVILKIKIRSPKRPELVDQDQITILILRSRSDFEDFTQYLNITKKQKMSYISPNITKEQKLRSSACFTVRVHIFVSARVPHEMVSHAVVCPALP